MRRLAPLLCLVACAPPPPPATPVVREPPPLVLSEGSCFGLDEAEPAAALPLLGGRLILTPPAVELRLDSRPIVGLPTGRDSESLLWVLPSAESSLLVWTVERFRRVEEGELEEALETLYERDPRFAIRALAIEELEAAAAIPHDPIRRDGRMLVAEVFTRTSDGLVQQTSVFTDPTTASTPGCQRAAVAIASTLRPGRRALPVVQGRVALRPGLTIELEAPHVVEMVTGADHSVAMIHGLEPLVAEAAPYLGVHIGASPTWAPPESVRLFEAELAGRPARWFETRVLHTQERAGLTTVPGLGSLHVFMGAPDRGSMRDLQSIVDTLSTDAEPDPAPTCETIDGSEPVRSPELEDDPAVAALEGAERFASAAIAFDDSPATLVAAFRRLAARADAGRAFEHLAASDSTVARLWGLAGLAAIGDGRFDPILCHVAPTLEGTVEVHGICGVTTVGVSELIEREDAPRSPGFWQSNEYRSIPRDLRGRGIAQELRWGPLVPDAVETGARLLGGGATPPETFDGDRRADPVRLHADRLCATRRDGRWACFGENREWLYPASVAHPRATTGLATTCFVDGEGRRACAGSALDRALSARAATCGGDSPEPLTAAKAFDDGPWRLVDLGHEACGIDAQGTLHCFRGEADPPRWVRGADRLAYGAAYPVLAGGITGASRGHGTTRWAWTESGRVFRWSADERPTAVAELEGLERIVGGMRITFAQMEDGRVLALGPQPGEPWWDMVGNLGHEWVELPALHGGELTVDAYHGCARFNRGVVKCWGASGAGQLGSAVGGRRSPPTEVRDLRGARSLHLTTDVTCALLSGDRLRCVGSGAPFLGEGEGRRDVRLGRRIEQVDATTAPNEERPPPE